MATSWPSEPEELGASLVHSRGLSLSLPLTLKSINTFFKNKNGSFCQVVGKSQARADFCS